MDLLMRDDLRGLMARQRGPSVSIFVPTHRAGAETRQGPIRLKNLLREAERQLLRSGLRAPEAKSLLEPARGLLQDSLFWQYQSDLLALFVAPETFRCYRLPLSFGELVVVTDRFHIKPLLPLFSGDGQFYLLALSQNEVRLIRGTRDSVSEVDLEGVPQGLAEALRFDRLEKQLQLHTSGSGGRGAPTAVVHGHGVGTDEAKENIRRYFRQIDRGLRGLLREERAPLLLAGVDYLLPIYREVNSYPHLVSEGIEGNPEELRAQELHERAWAIVGPLFRRAQEEAAAKYRQLAGTGLTSTALEEVIPAAYHKRVETLFVALGLQRWGAFSPETRELFIHEEPQPGDEDLLDFAAVYAILNGGTVYAVEPERVPDGALLAAILRY